MLGLSKHIIYSVLLCFMLAICIVLMTSTSHAVRYGHIKEIVQPIPPDMKCAEPGDSPIIDIRSSNGTALSAGNILSDGNSKQDSYVRMFKELRLHWYNIILSSYWIVNIPGYSTTHER